MVERTTDENVTLSDETQEVVLDQATEVAFLQAPNADEAIQVEVEVGGNLQIEGLTTGATFLQDPDSPGDLIINLQDAGQVILTDFLVLSQTGLPPALTLADGSVISAQGVLDLIDNLDLDAIATAAGGAAGGGQGGGGAGFAGANFGDLEALNRNPGDLNDGLGDGGAGAPEADLAVEVPGGTVTLLTLVTTDGEEGGLEDTPMSIEIEAVGTGTSVPIEVEYEGVPAGYTVTINGESFVTDGSAFTADVSDEITLLPFEDTDADFTLTANVTFQSSNGATAVVSAEYLVVVDADIDAPEFDTANSGSEHFEDSGDNAQDATTNFYDIGFSTASGDIDGSEQITSFTLNVDDIRQDDTLGQEIEIRLTSNTDESEQIREIPKFDGVQKEEFEGASEAVQKNFSELLNKYNDFDFEEGLDPALVGESNLTSFDGSLDSFFGLDPLAQDLVLDRVYYNELNSVKEGDIEGLQAIEEMWGRSFDSVIKEQKIESLSNGDQITLWADVAQLDEDGAPILDDDGNVVTDNVLVDATVSIDASATPPQVTFTFDDPSVRVQSVDMVQNGLQVGLPAHSDDDLTFTVETDVLENPTDGETNLDNNDNFDADVTTKTSEPFTLKITAVVDGLDQEALENFDDTKSTGLEDGGSISIPEFTLTQFDQDGSEGITKVVMTIKNPAAGSIDSKVQEVAKALGLDLPETDAKVKDADAVSPVKIVSDTVTEFTLDDGTLVMTNTGSELSFEMIPNADAPSTAANLPMELMDVDYTVTPSKDSDVDIQMSMAISSKETNPTETGKGQVDLSAEPHVDTVDFTVEVIPVIDTDIKDLKITEGKNPYTAAADGNRDLVEGELDTNGDWVSEVVVDGKPYTIDNAGDKTDPIKLFGENGEYLGDLTVNGSGTWTFAVDDQVHHNDGKPLSKLSDTFQYKITDSDGQESALSAEQKIVVKDTGVKARDDVQSFVEDTEEAISGNVLLNDKVGQDEFDYKYTDSDGVEHDIEGEVVQFQYVGTDGWVLTADAGETVTTQFGTFTLNADGSYDYALPATVVDHDEVKVMNSVGGKNPHKNDDLWEGVTLKAFDLDDSVTTDGLYDGDNATGEIVKKSNGLGVDGGTHAGGNQINFEVDKVTELKDGSLDIEGRSQSIAVEFDKEVIDARIEVSNMMPNEKSGELGSWTAYNEKGEAVATGTLETTDSHNEWFDINSSEPFTTLVVTAEPQAATREYDGDKKAPDNSDFFLKSVQFITIEDMSDLATDSIRYQMQDTDGDKSWANLNLEITDGADPTALYTNDTWETPVDEATVLVEAGAETEQNAAVSGDLKITKGSDPIEELNISARTDGDFVRMYDDENEAGDRKGLLEVGGEKVTVDITKDDAGTTTIIGETAKSGDQAFKLVVELDGSYTFHQNLAFDHPDVNQTGAADVIKLEFPFHVVDQDGDIGYHPTLGKEVSLFIEIADDGPTASWSAADTTVVEDDVNGTGAFAEQGTTATLKFDLGNDENSDPVTDFTLKTDDDGFLRGWEPQPVGGYDILSGDEKIKVEYDGLNATGTTVSGKPVFTFEVTSDGSVVYTQTAPIDHDSGPSLDGQYKMWYGFTVTDGDGDTASRGGSVTISDSAPVANQDDDLLVTEGDVDFTSGVNLLANDDQGGDGATVTAIKVGEEVVKVSEMSADGQYFEALNGTLKVAADGSWSFKPDASVSHTDEDATYVAGDEKAEVAETVERSFEYQLTDGDGDVSTDADTDGNWTAQDILIEDGADPSTLYTNDTWETPVDEATALVEAGAETEENAAVSGDLKITKGTDDIAQVNVSAKTDGGFVRMYDDENEAGNRKGLLEVGGENVTVDITKDDAGTTTIIGSTAKSGDQAFKLVVELDGSYTFHQNLAFDHPDVNQTGAADVIRLEFPFHVVDSDGDRGDHPTQGKEVSLMIEIADDGPAASWSAADTTVVENDVDGTGVFADQGTTATLKFDLGNDENSDPVTDFTLKTDDADFLRGWSSEDGGYDITSGGEKIKVTYDGLNATGTTENGTPVFTFVVTSGGAVTYTQTAPIDHDSHDSLDGQYKMWYGFTVTDGDGDTASRGGSVTISDSAPVANQDDDLLVTEGDVDFTSGVNLLANDDQGGDGATVTAIKVGEEVVKVSEMSADGQYFEALNGTLKVAADGSWSFKPDAAVDHTDEDATYVAGDEKAEVAETVERSFEYQLTDGDGDLSNDGNWTAQDILIEDGADPSTLYTKSSIDEADAIVSENSQEASVSGDLKITKGTDAIAAVNVSVKSDGGFVRMYDDENPNGAKKGLLEVGGEKVTSVSSTDAAGTTTITGTTESGDQAFKLVVKLDGSYDFYQNMAFDHPDAGENGADDVIKLEFPFHVVDADGDRGDRASDGKEVSLFIEVADGTDASTLYTKASIDEASDIVATDSLVASVDGDLKIIEGTDEIVEVNISAKTDGGFVRMYDDENAAGQRKGLLEVGGEKVIPVSSKDAAGTTTIIGQTESGEQAFKLVVKLDGSYEFYQNMAFDQPDVDQTGADDVIKLEFPFHVVDADGDRGDRATDGKEVSLMVEISDDGPTVSVNDDQNHKDLDEKALDGHKGDLVMTGTMSIDGGVDGAKVTDITLTDKLTANKKPVETSLETVNGELVLKGFVAADSNDKNSEAVDIFLVKVDEATGSYSFELKGAFDHLGKSHKKHDVDFEITVTDGDGDTAKDSFSVKVEDDKPRSRDNHHDIDLTEGDAMVSGSLFDHHFNDSADGSRISRIELNNVKYTVPEGGFIIKPVTDMEGGVLVTTATLKVWSNGDYELTPAQQVQHNGSTATTDFRFEVTDADGDKDWNSGKRDGQKEIIIRDTEIVAKDDSVTLDESVTGKLQGQNVLTNDLKDTTGVDNTVDNPAVVTGFTYIDANGKEAIAVISEGGSTTVNTKYGSLSMKSDGEYSYELYDLNGDGIRSADHEDASVVDDKFTYTMKDGDGDPSTADLTISIKDDVPVRTDMWEHITVDEADLGVDPVVVKGTLADNVDFGADGFGSVSHIRMKTEEGPEKIIYNEEVKALDEVRVETGEGLLVIDTTTGEYTFTFNKAFDHTGEKNTVKADMFRFGLKDSDGDAINGEVTMTLNIKDGGVTVKTDSSIKTFEDGSATAINPNASVEHSVNVLTDFGSSAGADGLAKLTLSNVSQEVESFVIVEDGNGLPTGEVKFTVAPNWSGDITFTYTMTDGDGTEGTATGKIEVQPVVDAPEISAGDLTYTIVPGAELVTNGSFQEGVDVGTNWKHFEPSKVPGWESNERIEIQGTKFNKEIPDGDQFLELDYTTNKVNEVWQELDTTPGEIYELTFSAAGRTANKGDKFEVYWGDKLVAEIDPTVQKWDEHTFVLEATGEKTKLLFKELGSENDSYGSYIDAVSVTTASVVYDLDIKANLVDIDRSETLSDIVLSGFPSFAKFYNENGELVKDAAGTLTLTESDLEGLTISVSKLEGFTLKAEVTSFEQGVTEGVKSEIEIQIDPSEALVETRIGQNESETIEGEDSHEAFYGNGGDDILIGNGGNDTFIEAMDGSMDTFVVGSITEGVEDEPDTINEDHDTIIGFEDGKDKVDLDILFDALGVETENRLGLVEGKLTGNDDADLEITIKDDKADGFSVTLKDVHLDSGEIEDFLTNNINVGQNES